MTTEELTTVSKKLESKAVKIMNTKDDEYEMKKIWSYTLVKALDKSDQQSGNEETYVVFTCYYYPNYYHSLRRKSNLNQSLALFKFDRFKSRIVTSVTRNKNNESIILIKVADDDLENEESVVVKVTKDETENLGSIHEYKNIDAKTGELFE